MTDFSLKHDSSAVPYPHGSVIPVLHIARQYNPRVHRFQVHLAKEMHVRLVEA